MSKLRTLIVVLEVIEEENYSEALIKESWGIEALQEAEDRWNNSLGCRTSIMRQDFYDHNRGFYDRDSWFGTPWKIEYTFRYPASYSEVLK